MILKLFRDNQVFIVLLCLLLSVFIWILTGFNKTFDPGLVALNYSSIFQVLPNLENINNYQPLASFINVVVFYLSGFYLSRIIMRYQIIPRRTALPMFIFMVLSMPYFQHYLGISYPLLTFFALLFILDLLLTSIDNKTTSYRFFDCALLLSTASILNFYLIFFFIFLVFAWVQFRGGNWRELVFLVIGLLIPYVFYTAILYITDMNILLAFNAITNYSELKYSFSFALPQSILGLFLALLFLIASVHMLRNYSKMKIITRKYSLIFLLLFATTILIILLYPAIDKDYIIFLALPISFLFSFYFSTCRPVFLNQILFLLFILGNLVIILL